MPSCMNMQVLVLFVLGSWLIATIDAKAGGGANGGGWRIGRATLYGEDEHGINDGFSIHEGSCQFGPLDRDVGTGWDIAAMSDCHPDFQGSCGKCFELACEGMEFSDNYGEVLDKLNACHDSQATVVVTVVDSCPCNFPKNPYSNKRWCCGDMDHLDISSFAFEKLAPKSEGVIGLKYRPVPCPSYEAHLPDDPENIQVDIAPNSLLSSFSSTSRVSRTSTADSTMTKHTTSVVIDHPDESDSTEKSVTTGSVTSTSSTGAAVVSKGSMTTGSVTSTSSTGAAVVAVGGSSGVSIKVNAGARTKGSDIVKRAPSPAPSDSEKNTEVSEFKARVKAIVAGEPSAPTLAPTSDAGRRVSRTSSADPTSTHVHWSGWDSSPPPPAKSDSDTRESVGFVSIGGLGESVSSSGGSSRSEVSFSKDQQSPGGSARVSVSGGASTRNSKTGDNSPPAKSNSDTRESIGFVSIGGVAKSASNSQSEVSFSQDQHSSGGFTRVSISGGASTGNNKTGDSRNVVNQRVSRTSSSDDASTRENELGGGHSTESTIPEFDVPRMG